MDDAVQSLIDLLADGGFHSGEELGQALGVSRAAIWKRLQGLEVYDLKVERVRGKGYRLPGGLSLLRRSALEDALGDALANLVDLQLNLVLPSTNEQLLQKASPPRSVSIAEMQTAGRGRRGRVWSSPFGCNLYFSISWDFASLQAVSGLSLAVGAAVVEELASIGIDGLALKWPNDVLRHGKKLGGILVELSGDANGECKVVVGLGLNIHMPRSTEIDQPWADLSDLSGPCASREKLLAQILKRLISLLSQYESSGFGAWRKLWESWSAFQNREVSLQSASGDPIWGLMLGVDEQGGLLLEVDGQVQSFVGGELSLRPR